MANCPWCGYPIEPWEETEERDSSLFRRLDGLSTVHLRCAEEMDEWHEF